MTIRLKEIPMEVKEELGHEQQEEDQDQEEQQQQQQQVGQQEQYSEESVRARLLAISQVEPSCCCCEEVLPLESVGISKNLKAVPQPTAAVVAAAAAEEEEDADAEFRNKLMGISYVEAALPEQEAFSVYIAEAIENASS